MGGFRGGGRRGCSPPFFLGFYIHFLKVIIFRVVLCNSSKDVHMLWVWSEFAFSPKNFWPPLSEYSGSALAKLAPRLRPVVHRTRVMSSTCVWDSEFHGAMLVNSNLS